jgi:phage-related protein
MYEIIYYNQKVNAQINKLPDSIKAAFMRIRGMMINYGPNLSQPYTKPLGKGLFKIRAKGKEGIGRVFYCTAG